MFRVSITQVRCERVCASAVCLLDSYKPVRVVFVSV